MYPLETIRRRISDAEIRYERKPGSVRLLAISKTQPPEAVSAVSGAGQRDFGENYVQEAAGKVGALAHLGLEWHFVGPVQSNKTRVIAEHFAWVHSVDRVRIAERLSAQREGNRRPLNLCIQVNVSGEPSKSGVTPDAAINLANSITALPNIILRGVMAIPAPAKDFQAQRQALRPLVDVFEDLRSAGYPVDTLSMGMSNDLEAAIAEGSTMVRIGTAIFGPRRHPEITPPG